MMIRKLFEPEKHPPIIYWSSVAAFASEIYRLKPTLKDLKDSVQYVDAVHLMNTGFVSQLPPKHQLFPRLSSFGSALPENGEFPIKASLSVSELSTAAPTALGSPAITAAAAPEDLKMTTVEETGLSLRTAGAIVPSLVGAMAHAGSIYYSNIGKDAKQQPPIVEGIASGLAISSARFISSSICLNAPFMLPWFSGGIGDMTALAVFSVVQRSRYQKIYIQGFMSNEEATRSTKRAIYGAVGGLLGSQVARLLFGDSGAAKVTGTLCGSYVSTELFRNFT